MIAGGYGELVGYFGSRCPHGPNIHLSPVYVSCSVPVTNMSVGNGAWSVETPTEPCADCSAVAR